VSVRASWPPRARDRSPRRLASKPVSPSCRCSVSRYRRRRSSDSRVDLDALFSETGNLSGRVVHQDGSPVAGGSVSLSDGTHSPVNRAPDANGHFSSPACPPGELHAHGHAPAGGGLTASVPGVSVVARPKRPRRTSSTRPRGGPWHPLPGLGPVRSGWVEVSRPGFYRSVSVSAASDAGQFVSGDRTGDVQR